MKEKDFRKQIVQMLKPLRAFPVENEVYDGVPDVCCVAGWIELKVASTPMRPDTPVKIGLRPAQGVWLKGWRRHGGRAWGLLLLDDEYILLHDGHWVANHYDTATFDQLWEGALMVCGWASPIVPLALQEHLLKPMQKF